MNEIIPPRVPFTDPKTGMIAREWYLFLLEWFMDYSQGTIPNLPSSNAVSVQALQEARNALLLGSSARTSPSAEVAKNLKGVEFMATRPNNDAAIHKLRQRVADDEVLLPQRTWAPEFGKLRQKVSDLETLIALQRQGSGTSSGAVSCVDVLACIDCDVIEALGYWSPVTDGASNIIYSGGAVVVAFTCTS